MRKKGKVLLIAYLAAALAVAGGFTLHSQRQAARYRLLLENGYTHAYYELADAVAQLDAALQKGQYATTPAMMGVLCTDIYGKAVCAQMALGELPNSGTVLEQTSAFLARTGDYACALAKSSAAQGYCSQEDHATMRELAAASSALSAALLDLQSDLEGGSVSVDDLLRTEQALAERTGDGQASPGGTAFQSVEADFLEVPALIYDGPFSEHLGGKDPMALKGLPQVGRDEARATAAEFLGLRPEVFSLTAEGEGVLPVWSFSADVDGGELYVEVTREGGKVLSLFNSRAVGDAVLSPREASDIARQFLMERGFEDMAESYHINQGNVLTIHFAPTQAGVLCYPDLVKVSVALDTGSVMGFESHGWIMNHTERELPSPAVTEQAAREVVSPDLEILSHQMALIPTGGEFEVLCHEFKCRTGQDTHVIVYVNAVTGDEQSILLLLEDESGTLIW